jgi:hypothetical protein
LRIVDPDIQGGNLNFGAALYLDTNTTKTWKGVSVRGGKVRAGTGATPTNPIRIKSNYDEIVLKDFTLDPGSLSTTTELINLSEDTVLTKIIRKDIQGERIMTQTLSALSSPIVIWAEQNNISVPSAGSITAAPTIASGWDSQVIRVTNVGTKSATLQDASVLASSNLRLDGGTNKALTQWDTITLMYSVARSAWVQIAPVAAIG